MVSSRDQREVRLLRRADLAAVGADLASMPAYLESSKPENVPIYRSVGFEVTKELKARDDAPVLYAMWREPKALTS